MSWSVIIPAAGNGSRLGGVGSKLLYKICGQPIANYLLPRFSFCDQRILVLSSGVDVLCCGNIQAVIQDKPLGMADAVVRGLTLVQTEFVCVVWGDQIIRDPELIPRGIKVVQEYGHDMCCPITIADPPYTHIRHEGGRIQCVLQAREGDEMPLVGVSDVGVFFFRTAALREALREPIQPGAKTGELNFLPVLTRFDSWAFTSAQPDDVVSVNTPEDARRAERLLWVS